MRMQNWIRFRSVGYLVGKGLSFGCGDYDIFPKQAADIGKYLISVDVVRHPLVNAIDDKLGCFADGGFDYIVVGSRFSWVPDSKAKLKSLARKLRVGGHMIIALPIMHSGANVMEMFDSSRVKCLMDESGCWLLKAAYEREGWLLQIYKKLDHGKGVRINQKSSKPRACVCRYGALGDVIILTPLLQRLHEDGYEVTCNFSTYSLPLLEGNPYVSNIIPQERDAIPNKDLGEYWNEWRGEYDKYINLSESLEGRVLKVEGRRDYYTSNAWRNDTCNKNYYDLTLELGGYSETQGKRGALYFTKDEENFAKQFRGRYKNKFIVLWALNGSSHHKVYALMEVTMRKWLEADPRRMLVTVGDRQASMLEFEHPQVIGLAGKLKLRDSLVLTRYVDLVVGPESVVINAAGCFNTPKIPLLSHSTHENLCKYFVNDYCLAPNIDVAKCYPCHQLHYTLESCPILKIQLADGDFAEGPACAMGAIEPDRLISRLNEVENAFKQSVD